MIQRNLNPDNAEARLLAALPDRSIIDTANLALEYLRAGIGVVPMRLDGSKRPQLSSWKQYQSRPATESEMVRWFSKSVGIGLVCGVVSGGLEVLDFDDGKLFDPWYRSVEDTACWLPAIETPSGGYHVLYRCREICGNEKIAVDPCREKQTLIETRGEGGLIVGAGSPLEVHQIHLPYIQVLGPSLPDVPEISKTDRRVLWEAARRFDRSALLTTAFDKLRKKHTATPRQHGGPLTPWDDFNARCNWCDLLSSAGWKSRDGEHWTRPGKQCGTSATLRRTQDNTASVLVNFSPNAGIDVGTHTAFSFYKSIYAGGDSSHAVRLLRREGFGNA